MTKKQVLDLMRTYKLFTVDTKFRPKKKVWGQGEKRMCNTTYLSMHEDRRPTKLDYFLVSDRWQGSVVSSKTKWGASYHRFGSKFDHSLLTIE